MRPGIGKAFLAAVAACAVLLALGSSPAFARGGGGGHGGGGHGGGGHGGGGHGGGHSAGHGGGHWGGSHWSGHHGNFNRGNFNRGFHQRRFFGGGWWGWGYGGWGWYPYAYADYGYVPYDDYVSAYSDPAPAYEAPQWIHVYYAYNEPDATWTFYKTLNGEDAALETAAWLKSYGYKTKLVPHR